MRNVAIFTVAVVITASSMAFSQSAPIFARVDSNPDGTATLTIRNDSNVSLVAFVDTEEYYSVGSDGKKYTVTALRYWDVATDITARPVAPHHDIGMLTGIRGGSKPQAFLMAAVFADGSSFGDPIWVQRIMHRRQVAREGFDLALSLLENGSRQDTPRAVLIEQLTASKDRSARGAASGEIEWATRYHNLIIHNLTRNTHDTTGAAISDQRAMEGVMRLLVLYRDRFVLYGVQAAASSHRAVH